ncbi:YjcQ family protein [Kurthia senegalensis]|uniref:YjcQ family protein n=1 Tax=Kurthia senegalensis TaxID=1033740 RepID=UPI0002892BAE|nr:YjcQ family protein [Kurthia senegalensis]
MNEARLTYSILKEIERKNGKISAADYGIDPLKFRHYVMNLQKEGMLSNVHLGPDETLDFKKVEIQYSGMKYLADHFEWIMPYRNSLDRKAWIEL